MNTDMEEKYKTEVFLEDHIHRLLDFAVNNTDNHVFTSIS